MPPSASVAEEGESASLASLQKENASLKSQLAARDAELKKLRLKVSVQDRIDTTRKCELAAQNDELAAASARLDAQTAVIASLRAGGGAPASAEAAAASARVEASQLQRRLTALMCLCERVGMPLPAGDGVPGEEYSLAVEHAFAEKVRVAAEGMAAAAGGGARGEGREEGKGETSRAVECLKLLAGAEEFGLSEDGTSYRISIKDRKRGAKVRFLIGWDETFVDYAPVEVKIADGKAPGFLEEPIEFKHDQAPIFFSKMLIAVFGDGKG